MLGVAVDEKYEQNVLRTLDAQRKQKSQKEQAPIPIDREQEEARMYGFDMILGYTSGGAPFGICFDEAEEAIELDFF